MRQRNGCATKCRDGGSACQKISAAAMPITPTTPTPKRQPKKSASTPVINRPPMPPTALPLIYSPMPRPIDSTCISSLRYVIATAGRPLKVSPSKVRTTSSAVQSGITAVTSTSTADDSSDTTITDLRPHASDSAPANNIANASTPVVSDNDSAAPASLTP